MSEHEHVFGLFEHSRLAGTLHRKCQIVGCRVVSLDGDYCVECGGEDEIVNKDGVCGTCRDLEPV